MTDKVNFILNDVIPNIGHHPGAIRFYVPDNYGWNSNQILLPLLRRGFAIKICSRNCRTLGVAFATIGEESIFSYNSNNLHTTFAEFTDDLQNTKALYGSSLWSDAILSINRHVV